MGWDTQQEGKKERRDRRGEKEVEKTAGDGCKGRDER